MATHTREEQTHQQNGHSQTYIQDQNARAYILSMRDQIVKPEVIPDVGQWWHLCKTLAEVFDPVTGIDKPLEALLKSDKYPGSIKLVENTPAQTMAARAYILNIRAHKKPESIPDVGDWRPICSTLARAFDDNPGSIELTLKDLCQSFPGLEGLLENEPLRGDEPIEDEPAVPFPPLDKTAYLAPETSENACPELDTYVTFSKKASPRAYDKFHIFCGLWLLAVIAARRVYLAVGRKRFYTNLMIVFCADSSMFAKSFTSDIARDFLFALNLQHLLAPNRITPAKLLSDMSGSFIPSNFDDLDPAIQERIEKRLKMSGQNMVDPFVKTGGRAVVRATLLLFLPSSFLF